LLNTTENTTVLSSSRRLIWAIQPSRTPKNNRVTRCPNSTGF